MRGGSNGRGNFTFMQAVVPSGPSGLDHVPVRFFNSPLPGTARQEDPLRPAGSGPTRGAHSGRVGHFDMAFGEEEPCDWQRCAGDPTNSDSDTTLLCLNRRNFMHLDCPHAAALSHLIQLVLPYITWLGQDTLFTCQFHSLFEFKKRHKIKCLRTLLLLSISSPSGVVWSVLPLSHLSQSEAMGSST